MNDPKTAPAFPQVTGAGVAREPGLSQYAEVAARFHAGLVTWEHHLVAARHAFDHADAFFAELAKRTKS